MSNLVQLIHLVEKVKTLTYSVYDKTFFSELDKWFFRAISDSRICKACMELDGTIFDGLHLRRDFNLSIIDVNTLGGPDPEFNGLVHPNCRCRLIRITKVRKVSVVSKWED